MATDHANNPWRVMDSARRIACQRAAARAMARCRHVDVRATLSGVAGGGLPLRLLPALADHADRQHEWSAADLLRVVHGLARSYHWDSLVPPVQAIRLTEDGNELQTTDWCDGGTHYRQHHF